MEENHLAALGHYRMTACHQILQLEKKVDKTVNVSLTMASISVIVQIVARTHFEHCKAFAIVNKVVNQSRTKIITTGIFYFSGFCSGKSKSQTFLIIRSDSESSEAIIV